MKHPSDVATFQTNILQALQKNKVIQDKLGECQRLHYSKLVKDLQVYHLQEKYNRDLLYTWKKESYIRQLRKNLQEYQQKKNFNIQDPFYEYQVRSLDNIITGQQTVAIPPSEEERRLNINAKYHRFLQKNPLQTSSIRIAKSATVGRTDNNQFEDEDDDDDDDDDQAEENARGVEETWKYIHAQSANIQRRKQNNYLPNIHRSATINDIRRNRTSAKSFISSALRAKSSKVPITTTTTTTSEMITSPSNEKFQRSPQSSTNHLGMPDNIEPLIITSEALDNYTRADLVTMRSVRRPRKNPTDLNLLFETRKRICQINKQALDHHVCQRQWKLQTNIQQFDLLKRTESMDHVRNISNDGENSNEKEQNNIITI